MCNQLWMDMKPQQVHNCVIQSPDVTQDFSPDFNIEVDQCDQNSFLVMVLLYGHPQHMKWFKHLIYAQH